ncbi:MAG: hypothetical protein U9R74_04345 [Pseudomonadota bacterium]|nr:hypothetical protein [Pseudomonadota bacterium]
MKAITFILAGALVASVYAANELDRKMAAFEVAASLLCDKTRGEEQYQACVGIVAEEMDMDAVDLVAFERAHGDDNGVPDA